MAALPCKLIAQVAFKASGDVFHQIFANKPHHLANATPGKIQGCDLHHGDHGTNGAILYWQYTLDGKEETCKVELQDIDEEKKQMGYKFIEGDLLKLYKNLVVTFHVETKGDIDFVTWTIDYEMLDPNSPHPLSLLNFYIEWTNEIEGHILG